MRRPAVLRPLDRLPSIRAKLGSVIVFAVAATILIMYVAVGFALHTEDRYRQSQALEAEAQTVQAVGFGSSGTVTRALQRAVRQVHAQAYVVDAAGRPLVAAFHPPSTRALAGQVDRGRVGDLEFVGVPVYRQGSVVGAVYLSRRGQGEGVLGEIRGTAGFVRTFWWQLLLAGGVAAIIALGLARILARGMTQPIRDMAKGAERLARGDYSERVPVSSRDELGRLAESFNRMAAELENVERLRRDLVANVSHELKTPISALRAHLENLLDGVEEPDAATIAVMLDQSERLGRLVEQLLDLSRLESGDVPLEREPVVLRPLVDRVLRELEVGRPGHGVVVTNDVAGDLPPLDADRERVHQVLFNLLDNAMRFTPPVGAVTVSSIRRGDQCEVSVQDTGPGIPPEHRPFVFERFYRVDPSRSRGDGGTGIGLTIARSVVEAHGGRIWVDAAPAGGSAFRFLLPVSSVVRGPGTETDLERRTREGAGFPIGTWPTGAGAQSR